MYTVVANRRTTAAKYIDVILAFVKIADKDREKERE